MGALLERAGVDVSQLNPDDAYLSCTYSFFLFSGRSLGPVKGSRSIDPTLRGVTGIPGANLLV